MRSRGKSPTAIYTRSAIVLALPSEFYTAHGLEYTKKNRLTTAHKQQPPVASSSDLPGFVLEHKTPNHSKEAPSSRITPDGSISKSSRLLHIAVRNGTTGILLSLINAGADVNSHDASGASPLHLATQFRRAKILQVLINHGANINARNSINMTALEIAVRAQDEEIVNVLLSGGAELS